jgi:uncharacterized protein (TIGR02284 family)
VSRTGRVIAEMFLGGDMAVHRGDLVECLNDLIETCRDGENGFQTAPAHVTDPALKKLFSTYSVQRAQFASELESEVRQLGGTPATRGSVSTAFHRGWMNIKSIVTGGSDDAIVAECERGEDAAVENYQRVMKNTLPPNVLPVVKHQFTEVKRAHDRIRDVEAAA